MQFNEVKRIFNGCPDLVGLDENSRARLFWRGECQTFLSGANIYTENTPLDDSFGILLSGTLLIERSWKVLGQMKGNPLFGEMAYFTKLKERTATVRAGSAEVHILRFSLAGEELADSHFTSLKKFLGLQAWERFVSSSQREP
jgi:CRP-like cAMP-binding protein